MAHLMATSRHVSNPSTELELTLSDTEAFWLKAVLQNPIGGIDPLEEHAFDERIRNEIFNCLRFT
jgi:hypothetical protein